MLVRQQRAIESRMHNMGVLGPLLGARRPLAVLMMVVRHVSVPSYSASGQTWLSYERRCEDATPPWAPPASRQPAYPSPPLSVLPSATWTVTAIVGPVAAWRAPRPHSAMRSSSICTGSSPCARRRRSHLWGKRSGNWRIRSSGLPLDMSEAGLCSSGSFFSSPTAGLFSFSPCSVPSI